MIAVPIVLTALGFIVLGVFLKFKIQEYSVKAVYFKIIASILFISVAAVNTFLNPGHIFAMFAVIALACGLVGDILLDLKYVYRESDPIYTHGGFAAFAVGHILYVTGMYLEYFEGTNPLYIIIPVVLSIAAGFANIPVGKILKLNYGKFKVSVVVYATLLFMTFFTAGSLTILHHFETVTLIMLSIGGFFFVASDLILSGTYFGVGKERPVDIITNTVTYYIAQFVIAFSIFFI